MLFANIPGLHDYCDPDVFHAQCPPGMVIIVEEARYGRMGLGTCLKRDFGFTNCYRFVLLDASCSDVVHISKFKDHLKV